MSGTNLGPCEGFTPSWGTFQRNHTSQSGANANGRFLREVYDSLPSMHELYHSLPSMSKVYDFLPSMRALCHSVYSVWERVNKAVTFPSAAASPLQEICRDEVNKIRRRMQDINKELHEIDVAKREEFTSYQMLVDQENQKGQNLPAYITNVDVERYARHQAPYESIQADIGERLSALTKEGDKLLAEQANLEAQYVDLLMRCKTIEEQHAEF